MVPMKTMACMIFSGSLAFLRSDGLRDFPGRGPWQQQNDKQKSRTTKPNSGEIMISFGMQSDGMNVFPEKKRRKQQGRYQQLT